MFFDLSDHRTTSNDWEAGASSFDLMTVAAQGGIYLLLLDMVFGQSIMSFFFCLSMQRRKNVGFQSENVLLCHLLKLCDEVKICYQAIKLQIVVCHIVLFFDKNICEIAKLHEIFIQRQHDISISKSICALLDYFLSKYRNHTLSNNTYRAGKVLRLFRRDLGQKKRIVHRNKRISDGMTFICSIIGFYDRLIAQRCSINVGYLIN